MKTYYYPPTVLGPMSEQDAWDEDPDIRECGGCGTYHWRWKRHTCEWETR